MFLKKLNLNNLTISSRLCIGLGIIILFMVVLVATGIWSLTTINKKLDQILKINNTKIELAHNIEKSVNTIDKSILTAILVNDENVTKEEKKKIEDARAVFQSSIEKLEKLEKSAKGKDLIASIKENFTIAQTANDKAFELIASGNMNNAGNVITGTVQISSILTKQCSDMVKYQEENTAQGAKEVNSTYVRAFYLLLGIGGIVVAFAIFQAIFLTRSITKPLNEGVSVANRIADGDLTIQIDVDMKDETGQLLNAMKHMVAKLKNIISEVMVAATDMSSSSKRLSESSELMLKGAAEQASRAAQVATASEEMSQTILDIAKNTSSIESSATDTVKLAKEGEVVVDRSVEKVKAIAKTIGESAELIKSLGARSTQIGEIINVIDDIADQTNLLALNAAIEAARAGEVGRGFAVVADEVKKLAERAGNSTAEIGNMIKAIQNEVHRVVMSMESITKEVSMGVDLSNQAGDVLRNIVASVDQLHGMVQQIASATEEMAATSEEINRDIETIASVSKDTSGSSEHVAKASQELADLSVNLEKVVGGFRI
ncbi:MAG: methyl-accepting chemotaxis protein [Syntrophorhabdaceae bacterium]|nr:methyl-accepting chemotaxis protein [Syntrophorhabdaceae bacterium]